MLLWFSYLWKQIFAFDYTNEKLIGVAINF